MAISITDKQRLDELELQASGMVWPFPDADKGPTMDKLRTVTESAARVVREFNAFAEEQRRSGDLTPAGLRKKLADLARQELHRLDAFDAIFREAEVEKVALESKLRTPPPAESDSAARAIQAAEIRQALAALDDSQRMTAITGAIENGETATCEAVFMAPTFIARQLLPPGLLVQFRDQWAERRSPVLAQALRDLELGVRTARNALNGARTRIAAAAGIEDEDEIGRLARQGAA